MTRTIRMKDIAGLKANTTTAPYATTEPAKIGGVRGGGSAPVDPPVSNDGWQATLESNFMLADSFDDTEDWNPLAGGSYVFNPPTRTNGAPSIWGRYSNDFLAFGYINASESMPSSGSITFSGGVTAELRRLFSEGGRDFIIVGGSSSGSISVGETFTVGGVTGEINYAPKWIGSDHPVYRNRGKSLCINYNNFSNGIDGFGPSRMTTFFGEAGNSLSGLKKAHIFWMMYIDPEFYVQSSPGVFNSTGVQKLFDICSGHIGVNDWGTEAEKAITAESPQHYQEYGLNNSIVNITGGGLSTPERLFVVDNGFRAELKSGGLYGREEWTPQGGIRLSDALPNNDTDVHPPYLAKEWFGVEFAFDIGTVDTADGSVEMWLYDSNGNQVGYFSRSGDMRKVNFDHLYNLFTMGGNRICSSYGACDPEAHSRFYVDDFIIDDTRIGPSYFNLLTQFEGS